MCISIFHLSNPREIVPAHNVSVNSNWIHPPGQPPGISSKTLPGGSGSDFSKLPRGREFDKGGDFVEIQSETFCPCIGFISDKYRVFQKMLKSGEISNSNYAKRHLNVCSGGNLCSPFFRNFSQTPCAKIDFNVRISFV